MPTLVPDICEPLALLALGQGEGALPMEGAGGFGWVLLKTALLLVVVCLLAYVVIRFGLARLTGLSSGGAGPRAGRRLAVLERLSLEPRRSLQVVRVGEKVLLIGVGEGAIALLCELAPDEWLDAERREVRGGFKRALQRALEGVGGGTRAAVDEPSGVEQGPTGSATAEGRAP